MTAEEELLKQKEPKEVSKKKAQVQTTIQEKAIDITDVPPPLKVKRTSKHKVVSITKQKRKYKKRSTKRNTRSIRKAPKGYNIKQIPKCKICGLNSSIEVHNRKDTFYLCGKHAKWLRVLT